jgi:hypothetical protein
LSTANGILEEKDNSISLLKVEEYLETAVLWVIKKLYNKGITKKFKQHNEALLSLGKSDIKLFDHEVSLNQKDRIKLRDLYMEDMVGEGEDLFANDANFYALCQVQMFQVIIKSLQIKYII